MPRMACYGLWDQKRDDDNIIQGAEMCIFRRLLRVRWKDRRTNESVLEKLGVERTLITLINRRKLKYLEHAIRKPRTDLMKTFLQGRMEGTRQKSRPPIALTTNITKTSDMKIQEVSRVCEDREGGRRKIQSVSSSSGTNTDHG